MTDMVCTYFGDREGTLIAYLYNDLEPAARAAFDAHLDVCPQCTEELEALRGVRLQLATWEPPALPGRAISTHEPPIIRNQQSTIDDRATRRWWTDIPAWAQVAAALLVLGISAGLANLDIRYDQNGLQIRTGWSRSTGSSAAAAQRTEADPAPWRADLTALEQQLRSELRALRASAPGTSAMVATPRSVPNEAEILRRVRGLIEESERRQQSELALRVAGVVTEVNAQRAADLRRIDRTLGVVETNLGGEVMKQRQSLNYLIRVSQKQ